MHVHSIYNNIIYNVGQLQSGSLLRRAGSTSHPHPSITPRRPPSTLPLFAAFQTRLVTIGFEKLWKFLFDCFLLSPLLRPLPFFPSPWSHTTPLATPHGEILFFIYSTYDGLHNPRYLFQTVTPTIDCNHLIRNKLLPIVSHYRRYAKVRVQCTLRFFIILSCRRLTNYLRALLSR